MPSDADTSPLNDLSLHETVARNRAILASTLDPIVIIDARGIIQSASDSIERVFGYLPDEIIGSNVSILMPEPHRSMHDTYLARYRETGKTNILGRTREFDAVRKDGKTIPIELSVSRVDIPGESQPLFTGIIHDISARRRIEQERKLIQRLSLGISSAEGLDAALIVALKEICAMTGWDYGEAWLPTADGTELTDGPFWHVPREGLRAFRQVTKGTRLKVGEGLPGRVMRSRTAEWLTNLDPPESGTFLRSAAAREAGLQAGFAIPILSDGMVVAVLAFYAQRRRTTDKRLLELIATATAPLGAVIWRRRAEDALIESERRFREMLNNVQLIAVMLDVEGTVTFCDDYLIRLAGYDCRDDVVGRNWFELFVPDEERQEVLSVFREGLARGEIVPHYENRIRTRIGEHRLIAWSNSIMHGPNGEIIGATALGVDITEQRRIEAELDHHRQRLEELVAERSAELEATHEQLRMADRLASIGTLTAGLGHDMNNVLLPLRCRLDAIDQMAAQEECREHVAAIRNSVDYLQHLTDGLHLFALDPDDEEASTSVTDIRAWWDQVGPLLSRAVPRGTQFNAVLPDGLPPVAVPSHRLTQAMLNLIVNAGEAVDGDGRVQFRASDVKDGRFVRLRVIDNGSGMTPEVRQRVLEPFFTTKKRGLGTGLGLSLVRGIVQQAGGSINIDSEPGRGTIMTLLLPVAEKAVSPGHPNDQSNTATACVTFADARLATFVVVLLQGAGLHVVPPSDNGSPECDLWVAEHESSLLPQIERFVQEPRRRLILFGNGEPIDLARSNVVIINDADNFEVIRRTINEAAEELMEPNR